MPHPNTSAPPKVAQQSSSTTAPQDKVAAHRSEPLNSAATLKVRQGIVESFTKLNSAEIQHLKEHHPATHSASRQTREAMVKLLDHPEIKVASVRLQNNISAVLTNLALTIGQRINVAIRPDGQLQLVPETSTFPQTPSNTDGAPLKNTSDLLKALAAHIKQATPATPKGQPNTLDKPNHLNLNARTVSPKNGEPSGLKQLAAYLGATKAGGIVTSVQPHRRATLSSANTQLSGGNLQSIKPANDDMASTAKNKKSSQAITQDIGGKIRQISTYKSISNNSVEHREANRSGGSKIEVQSMLIKSHLRQDLPKSEKIHSFFNQIETLNNALKRLPENSQQQILSKPVLASIDRIQLLNNALTGRQLEASPSGKIIKDLLAKVGTSNLPAIKPGTQNIGPNENLALPSKRQITESFPQTTLRQELSTLQKSLAAAIQALPPSTTLPSSVASLPTQSLGGLDGLFQLLLKSHSQSHEDKARSLQGKVLEGLKKATDSALARLQSLQLKVLDKKLMEGSATTQLQLELPIKLQEGYGSLTLQIQELPYEKEKHEPENKEKDSDDSAIKSQWRVFMTFDFQDTGTLATEIRLTGESIRANLWSTDAALHNTVQEKLQSFSDRLTKAGLQVENVDAWHSEAPTDDVSFYHTLVNTVS